MLWSRNLQLHYPFENQANDYSGNARHGTVHGSGVYATKPSGGRCLYFDGVGDYVSTPSFGLSGTVVVFAADVRCKSHATVIQSFLSDDARGTSKFIWILRFNASNSLTINYNNGGADPWNVMIPAANYFASPYNDAWLHMVIAFDCSGKVCYFYRNAALFASPAMSGTPAFPSNTNVKYVGSANTTTYPLTDGYLQNVQLWTLPTMPPLAQMLANVNRLMLGMNPIW